ncbi:hypothetical protein ACJBU6_04955 [Exserohilum turcicum]
MLSSIVLLRDLRYIMISKSSISGIIHTHIESKFHTLHNMAGKEVIVHSEDFVRVSTHPIVIKLQQTSTTWISAVFAIRPDTSRPKADSHPAERSYQAAVS